MTTDHYYLAFLGVDPPDQGHGIGSHLLQPVLDRADAEGVECYLETSNERNVAFYQRHNFAIVDTGTLPHGGPRFWAMRRMPQ